MGIWKRITPRIRLGQSQRIRGNRGGVHGGKDDFALTVGLRQRRAGRGWINRAVGCGLL